MAALYFLGALGILALVVTWLVGGSLLGFWAMIDSTCILAALASHALYLLRRAALAAERTAKAVEKLERRSIPDAVE